MQTKTKRPTLISPAAEAANIWVDTPSTTYNKDGEFSCKLRLDPENKAHAEFIKEIELALAQAKKDIVSETPKYKNFKAVSPIGEETNKDTGDLTGFKTINFKQKHKIKKKDGTYSDPIYVSRVDAKGNPLPKEVRIGRGSTIKLAFSTRPYVSPLEGGKIGISLDLKAVRVLKLVAPQAGGNVEWGGEDDGYEYVPEATEEGATVGAGTAGDGSEF